MTCIIVTVALIMIMCINVGVLGFWYILQLEGRLSEVSTPYVYNATVQVTSILENAELMSEDLKEVSTASHLIADHGTPDLIRAVNKTTKIIEKLERLSQHPVLKIALGDDDGRRRHGQQGSGRVEQTVKTAGGDCKGSRGE